jgi:peroxiredoxin
MRRFLFPIVRALTCFPKDTRICLYVLSLGADDKSSRGICKEATNIKEDRNMLRYFSIVLLCLAVSLSACSKNGTPVPAVEGKQAPDFTLSDLAGKKTTLSDLKGSVVLVNFWATWCPPCREEIPSMAALNRIMTGKPFRMLAISIDQGGKGAVSDYFNRNGVSLPALLDSDAKVGNLYGITGVPETFVIDKTGVILKKVVGPLDWSSPDVVTFLDNAMK